MCKFLHFYHFLSVAHTSSFPSLACVARLSRESGYVRPLFSPHVLSLPSPPHIPPSPHASTIPHKTGRVPRHQGRGEEDHTKNEPSVLHGHCTVVINSVLYLLPVTHLDSISCSAWTQWKVNQSLVLLKGDLHIGRVTAKDMHWSYFEVHDQKMHGHQSCR